MHVVIQILTAPEIFDKNGSGRIYYLELSSRLNTRGLMFGRFKDTETQIGDMNGQIEGSEPPAMCLAVGTM